MCLLLPVVLLSSCCGDGVHIEKLINFQANLFPDTRIFLNAGAMDLKQYHFVALVPLNHYEFGLKEVFCDL